jgi:hypothetical protein
MERLSLGPRCALHLLQVEDSTFVVGTDMTGVRSILPLPGSFDQLLTEAVEPPGPLPALEIAPGTSALNSPSRD